MSQETLPTLAVNSDKANLLENANADDNAARIYAASPYRWVIVTLFSLVYFGNCSSGVVYAIADLMCKYYSINVDQITWSENAGYFTQLPGCIIGTFISSWLGLRMTVVISSGLNAISACIMFAGAQPQGFPFFVSGYVIQTMSNCLVASLAPEISAIWFDKESQIQATSFGLNVGYYAGYSVGFLIPAIVFKNSERNKNMQFVGQSFFWIMTSQVVFTVVLFLLVLVLFKDRPKTPPTLAEAKRSELTTTKDKSDATSLLTDLLSLAKNRNVQFAAFSLALIEYSDLVIQGQLNQLLSWKYPGSESVVGWFGFGIYWVALAGATVLGKVVDRTKKWKLCAVIFSVVSTLSFICFSECLRQFTYMPLTFCSFFVHAFFSTPLTPVIADAVVEITYPIAPSHSYVYLLTITQVYAVSMVFVSGWLFQLQLYDAYLWIMSGAFVIATVLISALRIDSQRSLNDANDSKSSNCA